MATLRLRNLNSDEPAQEFVLPDADDDRLADILATIDEDLVAKGGIWLRLRVMPAGRHSVTWIPAAALVVHAEFDGDTPPGVVQMTTQRPAGEGGQVVDLRLYMND